MINWEPKNVKIDRFNEKKKPEMATKGVYHISKV